MSTGPTRPDDTTRDRYPNSPSPTRPQKYSGKWTTEETDSRALSTDNAPKTFSYSNYRHIPSLFEAANPAMLAAHLFEPDTE